MDGLLYWIGTVAGASGVAACLGAGLARIGGWYQIAGVATGTLFDIGVALMVLACLARLQQLAPRRAAG